MQGRGREVMLRDGEDDRYLTAWVDEQGRLRLDGQDFGPATAVVTSRGEYEWFHTIAAEDVPRVLELLGADEDADVLEVLERDWNGARSGALERLLADSSIDMSTHVI